MSGKRTKLLKREFILYVFEHDSLQDRARNFWREYKRAYTRLKWGK